MKVIVFMGITYKTQKSFKEFVKEKIPTIQMGHIKEGDKDWEFLLELYKRNPHYKDVKIDSFHLVPGRKGFDLSSVINGVYDPIGYNKSITQNVTTSNARMKKFARDLIVPQILSARDGLGKCCVLCEVRDNLEIDHYPRLFSELFKEFNKEYGGIDLSFNDLLMVHEELTPTQGKNWVKYHQERAGYRLLCGKCNKNSYNKK